MFSCYNGHFGNSSRNVVRIFKIWFFSSSRDYVVRLVKEVQIVKVSKVIWAVPEYLVEK